MEENKRIGIIGFGNMGSSVAEGVKHDYSVLIYDKDSVKINCLESFQLAGNAQDLIERSEIVVLAVKPQDFAEILGEIKDHSAGKLIISIAAGIPTMFIEERLSGARVIRAMPNLALKVSQGMTAICKGKRATESDLIVAKEIFDYSGKTILLDEAMMNAVTAVSGSGPGFFFSLVDNKDSLDLEDYAFKVFVPKLASCAEEVGFSKEEALVLADTTAKGSLALLKQTGIPAKELCVRVASKGGTTAAGLEKLRGRVENLLEAVKAAQKRAEELSKKE